jgi:hypothetical protein
MFLGVVASCKLVDGGPLVELPNNAFQDTA